MSKTFFVTLRTQSGTIPGVKAHALMVTAGATTHRLAVHQRDHGDWAVTHPESGLTVVPRVLGSYKGCPVSSCGMKAADAVRYAAEAVDQLLRRVGCDSFNAKIATAPRLN